MPNSASEPSPPGSNPSQRWCGVMSGQIRPEPSLYCTSPLDQAPQTEGDCLQRGGGGGEFLPPPPPLPIPFPLLAP
eukprot:755748-Hanusia_phi.AAC.4